MMSMWRQRGTDVDLGRSNWIEARSLNACARRVRDGKRARVTALLITSAPGVFRGMGENQLLAMVWPCELARWPSLQANRRRQPLLETPALIRSAVPSLSH